MYNNPITEVLSDMTEAIRIEHENGIIRAVRNVGFDVNKAELEKALAYDRGQYEKGYADAMADRPQGEWIDADGNLVPLDKDGCTTAPAWCSNCGEWLTGSDEYCTSGRFCPNCGARMKGAEDE